MYQVHDDKRVVCGNVGRIREKRVNLVYSQFDTASYGKCCTSSVRNMVRLQFHVAVPEACKVSSPW